MVLYEEESALTDDDDVSREISLGKMMAGATEMMLSETVSSILPCKVLSVLSTLFEVVLVALS